MTIPRRKGSSLNAHLDSDVRNLLDNLAVSAQSFRKGANRVRKKMWWQNAKVRFRLSSKVVVSDGNLQFKIVDCHRGAGYHPLAYYYHRTNRQDEK